MDFYKRVLRLFKYSKQSTSYKSTQSPPPLKLARQPSTQSKHNKSWKASIPLYKSWLIIRPRLIKSPWRCKIHPRFSKWKTKQPLGRFIIKINIFCGDQSSCCLLTTMDQLTHWQWRTCRALSSGNCDIRAFRLYASKLTSSDWHLDCPASTLVGSNLHPAWGRL